MDLAAPFTNILIAMGLPGLVIFLLGGAVVVLYRRNCDVSDKRVEDAQRTLEQVNTALSENTRTLETLATRLEGISHRG